ncbi:MAG: inositol monophosphatase family protein [Acidimicrobiia bacterium]
MPEPDLPTTAPADPGALLDLAAGLARSAGALLVAHRRTARREVATKSSPTDVVTEVDRASEALIVAGLRAARPHDGILAEEGTDDPGSSGVRWLVDPLDGTTNYLYGHPGYNVSIAAEVEGRAVAAAVFDPVHDELFTATLGGGARCNGRPVSVGTGTELATALVATGFSYDAGRRGRQARVLAEVLPRVRDVRRMGAAAVDLCSVACGRVDAYYERGLAPWDLAAGGLVAAEAGAAVRGLGGRPAGPEGIVAAGPGLVDALVELLEAAGADRA